MKIVKITLAMCALIVSCFIVNDVYSGDKKPMPNTSVAEVAAAPLPGSKVLADAWIYPDDPKSFPKLKEVGQVNAVKIEFLHVNDDGTLEQLDQSEDYPNGYSPENVAFVKEHSREQYITVSGLFDGTQQAMDDPATIPTIVALANKTDFNVELDWEEFGSWTDDYYTNYKQFVKDLRRELQKTDKKLMIDGPAIHDQTSQDWYKWKYEELAPLVDYVVMMVYDNQFDEGAGSAIAPRQWSLDSMQWLKEKAGKKAIAGIAAYGYTADESRNRMASNTSEQVARLARGAEVVRTADGELKAQSGDHHYVYSDKTTMMLRLDQVEESGLNRLSVWSLGSNPWFPGRR